MTDLALTSRRFSARLASRTISLAAGLLTLLGLSGACSSGSGGSSLVCQKLEGACGSSCSSDADCPTTTHCGASGSCTAECTAQGNECGGAQCTRGLCEGGGFGGFGGSSGGDGGGGEAGDAAGCAFVNVSFEPQTPTVILLVDQSGSMSDPFAGQTRWEAVEDALFSSPNGVVRTLDSQVRFGLSLYTSDGGFDGGECPILRAQPVMLGNFAALEQLYADNSPQGDTPTGESISAVAAVLAQVSEPGDKAIVLATDGEPDNCTDADAHDEGSRQLSVDAAAAALLQGVRTYVIAVGDDISDAHLQDVANAGLGGPGNAPFWKANDPGGLSDAFNTIIDGVRSCIFDLNGTVSDGAQGQVTLDGMGLVLNDPDGWRLNSATQLELTGAACETIKSGQHSLDVTFPCGVVQPR